MPELPEVETVRAGLESLITGRTVLACSVLHPRPVRRHEGGGDDFQATLVGRTFATPRRRGKFMWLPFVDGDALMAHLGMSGQFRVDSPAAPLLSNTRVLVDLDDGQQLRFVDQRMFGGVWVSPGGADLPEEVRHIALDPFDPHFDAVKVAHRIALKHSGIKRVLLDQTVVSGIGNIYADETLWRERLHYDTPAASLGIRKLAATLRTARSVMAEALTQGGTSFDALYVNVNGESGYFDRTLHAYGQEGRPCDRCGVPIRRDHFMNRSSFFCPRCQPQPRRQG